LVSRAEQRALDFLNERYGKRVSDLAHFRDQFSTFVEYYNTTGCPLRGLMALVDGHFQEVCRPGGLGNVFGHMLDQRELYNGHYSAHGLKWCVLLLPNGMSVVAGPYPGRETDITCLRKSGFLDPRSPRQGGPASRSCPPRSAAARQIARPPPHAWPGLARPGAAPARCRSQTSQVH